MLKIKNSKGFTGTDIVLSIILVIIFTSIILSLMYNVKMENDKIKLKTITNIYLMETLENIGIASYEEITNENINLFPAEMSDSFGKTINVQQLNLEDPTKEDIIKKVKVTISYTIKDKTYEEVAERLKIKE